MQNAETSVGFRSPQGLAAGKIDDTKVMLSNKGRVRQANRAPGAICQVPLERALTAEKQAARTCSTVFHCPYVNTV